MVTRRAVGRQTLGGTTEREGVGLHGGRPALARLGPGAPGSGVVFVRIDLPGSPAVRARPAEVTGVERTVRLGPPGRGVATVEHLLASLCALGIDDARVEVEGDELPALDGSAAGWVEALDEAGRATAPGEVTELAVETRVAAPGGAAALEPLPPAPAARLEIALRHLPGRGLPPVELTGTLSEPFFRTEIAPARTFCFEDELPSLRAAGLGRGGSLENAVVLDRAGRPLNPGGLRFPDEPARHKLLDALGDLALLGVRVHGRLVLEGSGHSAHIALCRALDRLIASGNPP